MDEAFKGGRIDVLIQITVVPSQNSDLSRSSVSVNGIERAFELQSTFYWTIRYERKVIGGIGIGMLWEISVKRLAFPGA